ncbi:MAG: DNA adenine methylase [Thermoplasmata archaeon]
MKWAGGKAALSGRVVKLVEGKPFRRYFEPFVGGGAVFFALRPKKAVLSDSNPELINAYTQIQSNVEKVIHELTRHQDAHSKAHYYSVRANPPKDLPARAAWFLYLNRTCYNGLWRVNSTGGFNVPMGSYKNPRIVDPEKLRRASKALKNTRIICADFEAAITRLRPRPVFGDVVYFDPPYVPLNKTSQFTSYTKEDFTEDDQRRLARVARMLAERGVLVILSNSETPLIRSLFSDPPFTIEVVHMPRAISSVGSRRGKIPELLIHN